MIFLSIMVNALGSLGTTTTPQYRFSFTQTYSYPEKLESFRLHQ